MSDLQSQQADATTVIIPDENAPPEPIEIDLDSGDATETPPAAATPAAAAAPKPRNKSSERIQSLARERDAERSMREQLSQELDQARRDAAQARSEAASAMQSGMENYAQRVTSEVAAAKEAYKAALAGTDADAVADAIAKLSKVSAAEADVDAWRAQPAPQAPAAPAAPQPQARPQPQMIVPSEPTRQFFEENDWFHPLQLDADGVPMVGRDGRAVANPNFDEDLHDAAMLIHKKIERQIKRGDLPKDYVETPEYFAQIKQELTTQFPEDFGEPAPQPQRRTPPMAPTRQPVAPATRTSMPTAPRPGGNKVTLTGEERQFVDSMIANGAMRYPSGHKEAGKPMQAKDAYLEYAKQSVISRANQQPTQ